MNQTPRRRIQIPRPLIYVMVIGIVASWVPLAFIARARAVKSPHPRVHIFQDMDIQPKYVAQDSSDVTEDGAAMRLPVEGTVARGSLQLDDHLFRGFETDSNLQPVMVQTGDTSVPKYFTGYPKSLKVDSALLKLGRKQYDIYCSACHGHAGYGDGLVHRRAMKLKSEEVKKMYGDKYEPEPAGGWVNPANFHNDTFREGAYPNGKLYDMIARGKPVKDKKGKISYPMPAYREKLPVRDRWAVGAYVRALQWSQAMPNDRVPEELTAKLPPVPKVPEEVLADPKLIAKGKTLFKTKICFTCHQVDPKTPAPAGAALKAPAFMGKFWGTKRQVHDGIDPDTGKPSEKILTVVFNEAYFIESVKKPMAKIVKGSVAGMAPLPTTDEEVKALMAYVKSLSK